MKLSDKQQDELRSVAHAFLRIARNSYIEIKRSKRDFLSEMIVIWSNTGLALELMLKWVLSVDGKSSSLFKSYGHKTYDVYNALSRKAKRAVEKIYSGTMSYAGEAVGKIELQGLSQSDNIVKTLPDMLRSIDDHKLLYDKRYSIIDYEDIEQTVYIAELEGLFGFINGLSRLKRFPNGNWGHKNKEWFGFGIEEIAQEQVRKFYDNERWEKNEKGQWTQKTRDGVIVVYDSYAYANCVINSGKSSLTKENSYLYTSRRGSRKDKFFEPYVIAELISNKEKSNV